MQLTERQVAEAITSPSRLPRHAEVLEAIIRTTDPDTAELLSHSLVHSPRNRAQARDQVRRMPRVMRRRYGQGVGSNYQLVPR